MNTATDSITPVSPKLDVLLIDDDPVTRTILSTWITRDGYRVVECDSAENAINVLADLRPDILVTDIQMQGMNGLAFTDHVKARFPEIPVVMVTGHSDNESLLNALNIGVDYLLTKPVNRVRLLSYLRNLSERIVARASVAVLQEALRQRSVDLERMRETDRAFGASVQQLILYRAPPSHFNALRCAYRLAPALKVSGDFLDYYAHDQHCLDVAIGDAMGKGLSAAWLSAGVKTAIARCFIDSRSNSGGHEGASLAALPTLPQLLENVLRQVFPAFEQLESFVTLFVLRIDLRQRSYRWIDCGHNKMILLRRGSPYCLLLHGDNLPLGTRAHDSYSERMLPMLAGDRILLLTDGVWESANNGEGAGLSPLLRTCLDGKMLDVEGLADRVLEHGLVDQTASGVVDQDDRTVLVMEVMPSPPHLTVGAATEQHQRLFSASVSELSALRSWLEISVTQLLLTSKCVGSMHNRSQVTLDEAVPEYASIELGLVEAFANIVRHVATDESIEPFRDDSHQPPRVWIQCVRFQDRIHIEIQYQGREFIERLHSSAAPDTETPAEGGYGLFLIRSCFDEVHYYADDSGYQGITLGKVIANLESGA